MKFVDLTGNKFSYLTVIKRDGKDGVYITWMCSCKCGNQIIARGGNLKSGNTKSCGCHKKEGNNFKHGFCGSRIYTTYKNMKARCKKPKKKTDIYSYLGKGIGLCRIWRKDFARFAKWSIENGYNDTLTIDRINPNIGYSPWNCQFISRSENSAKAQEQIGKYFPN
jgi:hypothetical protein